MSSERAGTPTHGTLDREKAREVLGEFDLLYPDPKWDEPLLDALEACVVPDPRIDRIATHHHEKHGENEHGPYVICDYDKTGWPCLTERILRGSNE